LASSFNPKNPVPIFKGTAQLKECPGDVAGSVRWHHKNHARRRRYENASRVKQWRPCRFR
jgi:hypothetical protein